MFWNRRKFKSAKHEEQRKKRVALMTALVLILSTLIIIGLSWLSGVDALTIDSITVEGNSVLREEEIQKKAKSVLEGEYVGLFSRSNSFIYPHNKLRDAVYNAFLRIEEIYVERRSLKEIYIRIKEREPIALVCKEACFFFDKKGYVFAQAPEFTGHVFTKVILNTEPIIGTTMLPEDIFSNLTFFIDKSSSLGLTLKEITVTDLMNADIRISSSEYPILEESIVKINLKEDLHTAYENLKTVLKQDAFLPEVGKEKQVNVDYIDLRFGSRVYYKLISGSSEEVEQASLLIQ